MAFGDKDNDKENDSDRTTPGSELHELSDGEYERERLENIKHRDALLSSLGLDVPNNPLATKSAARQPAEKARMSRDDAKKKKVTREREKELRSVEPVRKSRRVAERGGRDKDSNAGDDQNTRSLSSPSSRKPSNPINGHRDLLPKATAPILPPGPEYPPHRIESEKQPRPVKGGDGRLVFEGRWRGVFTPNVTPEEMFAGGAFGGSFFRDTCSRLLRTPLSSSAALDSLPFSLPPSGADADMDVSNLLTSPIPQPSVNRFQVLAGQSLEEWEKAGWIWSGDPRGWAEWYVRFWDGRRCEDDERQVKRWLKVAGPTGRFKRALLKKIHQAGGQAAVGDGDVGRVLRQCLWQWAYELTEREYEDAMRGL
ncbi:hypothetical protein I307_04295 [Cryptococcus deuterogattii 99/473]|uniref:Uncharacterized protein n=1 Tax=Cryptococcus deuterogattii Ram5 TaxID=1296110 RepID=A0A0D0TZ57_9TREE|nr:hypothetical protein I309_05335 [Cryptococcus deuterogattii LA55]KIR41223.1 hypothetical protein I313_02340 [Cryptococcus deuterogattii Ram5]KIR90036.1 hypothetical protein I304_06291 [Cryptococcus deuterogattii CBS 10090]KIY56193.1 hypothetical protein I307_04295 [Cryptococcus deuterogattii 99/473]